MGSKDELKRLDGFLIMLHKPHPGNTVKAYALKQVLTYLSQNGLLT